jgi:hypothetical protein
VDKSNSSKVVTESAHWVFNYTDQISAETLEVHEGHGDFSYTNGGTFLEHTEAQHTNHVAYYTIDTTYALDPSGSVTNITWVDSDGGEGTGGDASSVSIPSEEGTLSFSSPIGAWQKSARVKMSYLNGGLELAGQQELMAANTSSGDELAAGPGPQNLISTIPVSNEAITIGEVGQAGIDGWAYKPEPSGVNSVDVSPTVGVAMQSFQGPTGKTFVLTHQTLHPALTDTNRARTNLGVGEEVDFSGMPANTVWTGPGLLATNSGVAFFAPSNAPSGGTQVTITAQAPTGPPLSLDFTVFPPTGVDHADVTNADLKSFIPGQAGAGMLLHPYMAPTSVSFYRVQCEEVGEDASDVSNYFTNNPPFTVDVLSHRGNTTTDGHGKADDWFQIQENNLWQKGWDDASTPSLPNLPWSDGHFTWVIPGKWKIDDGSTNDITKGWDQKFTIDSSGTVTVTKFSHTVTRHINEITGTVN